MSEESSSNFVAPAGLLERVRNINQIYKQTVNREYTYKQQQTRTQMGNAF